MHDVRPSARLLLMNAVLLVGSCALAGEGVAMDGGSLGVGVVVVFCFAGPLRALSGALEFYLLRRRFQRGVAVSHLVGLVIGAMAATSRPTAPAPGVEPASGLASGVLVYLITALVMLGVTAVVALVRSRRRGPAPPVGGRPELSLGSLPAIFWFNLVFLLTVALVVTPSMAAAGHTTTTNAFFGGLLIALILRSPAGWAEWWLTRRAAHRVVFGIHLGAGALAVPAAVVTVLEPVSSTADGVAAAIAFYLILSGVALLAAVGVVALRPRSGRRVAASGGEAAVAPAAAAPVAARTPGEQRAADAPGEQTAPAVGPGAADVVGPAPRRDSQPVGLARAEGGLPERATEAAEKMRSQMALAVGIVAGLASLVQGFDSADPFRTGVLALVVGVLGLAAIYGIAIKRR